MVLLSYAFQGQWYSLPHIFQENGIAFICLERKWYPLSHTFHRIEIKYPFRYLYKFSPPYYIPPSSEKTRKWNPFRLKQAICPYTVIDYSPPLLAPPWLSTCQRIFNTLQDVYDSVNAHVNICFHSYCDTS